MAAAEPQRETAYAKLNLALHVRELLPDGYHAIETLFAFCEDGDLLECAADRDLSLAILGPFGAELSMGEDNLVMRAAADLRAAFGVTAGAKIALTKELPLASGIGGGSADAGAALRMLSRLWGLPPNHPKIGEIAAGLGADVPACLRSRTAIGRGRGDVLTMVNDEELRGMPVLLINPGKQLSTRDVFEGWDGLDRGGLKEDAPLAVALSGRNDLEGAARALCPAIDDALTAFRGAEGVLLARMSGSGATCFALHESEASRNAAAIEAARPDWWTLTTRLR